MSRGCRILAVACLLLVAASVRATPGGDVWSGLTALIPPVLATSCGQGTGTVQVRESCERLGVVCWDRPLLRMGDLGAACCADAQCPFGGVLWVVIEIYDQALRDLGIDIAYEIERCMALTSHARELGMVVVVSLLGEAARSATVMETEALAALAATADLVLMRSGEGARETLELVLRQAEVPRIELDGPQDLDLLLAQLFASAVDVAAP